MIQTTSRRTNGRSAGVGASPSATPSDRRAGAPDAKPNSPRCAAPAKAAPAKPAKAAPEPDEGDDDDHPAATRKRWLRRLVTAKPQNAPGRQRRADDYFGALADRMCALIKYAQKIPPLPEREVDLNWLRSPALNSVARMTEALDFLEPMMAEAEAMLERAKKAAPRKPKR